MRTQPVQNFAVTPIEQMLLDDDFDAVDIDAFEQGALHPHADFEDSWSDEALLEGI